MQPGRNDPCPCGSGKKYKHCCLTASQVVAAAPEELVWQRLRRLKDGSYATMMFRFVRDAYGEAAVGEAWDEFTLWEDEPFDPRSPHIAVFMPWLFCHWAPDPQETRVADAALYGVAPARALLQRKRRNLDPLLREYIESCLASPFSFHEVLASEPGRGLKLRDVITGDEYDVHERSASRHLQAGDLVYGQLASAQGVTLLEACGPVVIPPIDKLAVIELRQQIERGSAAAPREKLREYDCELRELYLDLTDRLLHPQMPEFQNTDGEKMVPQQLMFDIESAQEAYEALKHLDFEAGASDVPEDAEYTADGRLRCATIAWKKPGNSKNKGWSNTVLGHIRIEGQRMTADVNSHERAEAFRKIVEEKLRARARYRLAQLQSVEKLLAEADAGAGTERARERRELEEHPEFKARIAEMMARHYEQWIEDKIPALGNRTPLEAMREPDGPEKVEALLCDAERLGRRMDPPVDEAVFRRLRQRLGLPLS
ncbi:hypothetical protein MBSD_n1345 [Mizugakiibacter sediminis]|uniref:Antitoxin Xre/MbcA/ParS-like toxin-binding domain-containing protein n=1 Tax=Mizugakiibacter sediminis TaxID=1475481 RepID=A0A0K8QMF5_9GAMM|nr:SEC-C metal-binding domain-containing protein [Mizugakiibacter sediminis]GAP66043.1 hypothetical protein MBSD_n1345 [Mizugakiibacter sediminis]